MLAAKGGRGDRGRSTVVARFCLRVKLIPDVRGAPREVVGSPLAGGLLAVVSYSVKPKVGLVFTKTNQALYVCRFFSLSFCRYLHVQ